MLPSEANAHMRVPAIPLWAVALVAFGPIGLAAVLGFGWVGWQSCAGGTPAASSPTARTAMRELPLSGTTKVELAAPGDLVIALGEPELLRIDASKTTLERLTTDVQGDRLVIGTRRSVRDKPSFFLTVKRLDGITIASSGDVAAPDLKGDDVTVTLAGSGDLVAGQVEAKRVTLRLASSGDAKLKGVKATALEVTTAGSADLQIGGGQVEEQRVVINGSGDYDARQLQSARGAATINGSGSVVLWARESLKATIMGSGRVAYRGTPQVEQRVLGSGSVEPLGD